MYVTRMLGDYRNGAVDQLFSQSRPSLELVTKCRGPLLGIGILVLVLGYCVRRNLHGRSKKSISVCLLNRQHIISR